VRRAEGTLAKCEVGSPQASSSASPLRPSPATRAAIARRVWHDGVGIQADRIDALLHQEAGQTG